MSTVNSTSAADPYANINGTAATGKKSEIEEAQDRFLKLLVTQLQQQDPLAPVDNKEMLAQMAQFTSLAGINDVNATLQAMSGKLDKLIDASLAATPTAPVATGQKEA